MIHYQEYGSGKTLILIHGFCENISIWDKLIPELSSKFHIVALDLPGFGNSPLEEVQSIDDVAKELDTLFQTLSIQNPVIIGHSLGGYVASSYAHLFGEKLSGLIFFHSTAHSDSPEKKNQRNKTIQFLIENGLEIFNVSFVQNIFSDFAPGQMKEETKNLLNKTSLETAITYTEFMRDRNRYTDRIKALNIPKMYIAGKFDHIIPYDLTTEESKITGSSYELLEKSGHMGMLEEPLKSIEIIEKFLLP
ncbi:MAG: alpha/beta hydrolase [Cyclobacteriaceae bacterium]|nr:alpha/beta hydrolase [Cyclobacteriaceae bacterium]